MKDTTEILIPVEKEIKISDRTYKVGKFSVMQIIKLTRKIVDIIVGLSEESKKNIENGKSNHDDILSIFEKLNDKQIVDVVSLIIKEPDIEWIEKNGSGADFMNIIAAAFEMNDFAGILGNVQRVMTAITSQASSLPLSK